MSVGIVSIEFCVSLLDRSWTELHEMFTRTYGQLYEQNAHIFTSLFADLRAYFRGTDLHIGDAVQSFFSTLMMRMFRLLNAQYSLDDRYLGCVAASVRDLAPFGDVPAKLAVQLTRSLVAARTYYQGLVIGRRLVDNLLPVSKSSRISGKRSWKCMKTAIPNFRWGAPLLRPRARRWISH